MNQIVLLGPQRARPTVAAALDSINPTGRVAVISAGWQEREGELDHLAKHLAEIELSDLQLYARAEQVYEEDKELHAAWRQRQEGLKGLQRLYRIRLRHMLRAVRELYEIKGDADLIRSERADALAALRQLDEEHLLKIRSAHMEHWERWQSTPRPAVTRQRQELAELLEQCDTLLIAGGHVGVLLNRLRLFDIGPLINRLSLIAWSAGAMALSDRVVLFHDFPPQGAGDAEVFEAGLAAYHNVAVFPDASRRLALGDSKRVALLADRLKPATSIALDESAVLSWDGKNWHQFGPTQVLSIDGTVKEFSL